MSDNQIKQTFKQFIKQHLGEISGIVLNKGILNAIRKGAVFLALVFFIGYNLLLFLYEKNILDFCWSQSIPQNYYFSIYLAFTFILFYEVISFVFVIPKSIANSIGKQYEIMSLIILRSILEKVGEYQDYGMHLTFSSLSGLSWQPLVSMLIGIAGSVLIYSLVRSYYKMQRHIRICKDPGQHEGFVLIKKLISMILLVTIVLLALGEFFSFLISIFNNTSADYSFTHEFFEKIFTLLIFVDILLVFLTMRYTASYQVVFRISALMVSTIILRMSFSQPMAIAVFLVIAAILIGIGVTWTYNKFQHDIHK